MNSARKTSAASRTVGLFEDQELTLFKGEWAPKIENPHFVGQECLDPRARVSRKESK